MVPVMVCPGGEDVSVVRRLATHLVRAHHLADGAQSSVVRYRRVKEASVAILWLSQLVPRAHRSALHAQNFEGTALARAHLVHGSASVRPRPRTPVALKNHVQLQSRRVNRF